MFRNLEAEQARLGYTNTDVAKKLGISRVSYENKRKTENLQHWKLKVFVNYLNANLTIYFTQMEKGKNETMAIELKLG